MYENRIMKPIKLYLKGGQKEIRKSNRETEYDQNTLHARVEVSQSNLFAQLIHAEKKKRKTKNKVSARRHGLPPCLFLLLQLWLASAVVTSLRSLDPGQWPSLSVAVSSLPGHWFYEVTWKGRVHPDNLG
jgi:hypothetical protein